MENGDMPASPISRDLILPKQGESLPHRFPYGMTKRETFAMAAMQGMLGNQMSGEKALSQRAVQYADALLAELEKHP